MEGHLLNVGKSFLCSVKSDISDLVPGVRVGHLVQFYPCSRKGMSVGVRRLKKNLPVGPAVYVDMSKLYFTEAQQRELQKIQEESRNQNLLFANVNVSGCDEVLAYSDKVRPGDRVKIWYYSLEALVEIKKKKQNLYSFLFKPPIMVCVETKNGLTMMDISDLILNEKQKDKVKEILFGGIKNLAHRLGCGKREEEYLEKKIPRLLEKIFTTDQAFYTLAEECV